MDSDLPYTPVAEKDERLLFKTLLERSIQEGLSLNARETFQ